MHRDVILFDYGGTLVDYFGHAEMPKVLAEALADAGAYLAAHGLPVAGDELVRERLRLERHDPDDYRVRPLEERLARIFAAEGLDLAADLLDGICRAFMRPIFARGRRYPDAIPVLESLRARKIRLAVVSNTAWGSPSGLWREEISRFGLAEYFEALIFCRDAGWRKPAPQIFAYVLDQLAVRPDQCLFVGDDPSWDVAGPRAAGIEAVLLNREGLSVADGGRMVVSLHELEDLF